MGRPMRKLLDFDVVIEPHDDSYSVRVVASPAGEAQCDFVLPFSDKDLRILVLEVVGSISRLRRKVRRIESPDRQLLENFGGQLFRAVFSGHVGECLERSRMAAESRDAGLRIRLRVPGALANIPWEYLYDLQHGFLGLDPETALVRYLEMPARARPFPISPPLRILAMISTPSDVPGLEVEEEWSKLNDTLGDLRRRGIVQVDRLERGTLAALQRPLRLNEYHVLHFIGHGGYDENAHDGALALEGADREIRLVTGRDLGMMIRDHRSLRLVVLNACEGARAAPDDPFGGVAQALVRQGIPAVIAMQFEISDPAALVFSQSFYQAIADGLPVDVATVEARRAMFAEGNEVEWATPVLYLRSPDGRVFAKGRISPPEREARDQAERQAREQAQRQAREQAERQERERTQRQAREQAKRQEQEQAERQAEEHAQRQAREQAQRQAGEQAQRQAREQAERQEQEHAQRQAREQAERQEQEQAERQAREQAERRVMAPVLVAGPVFLCVPLLALALSYEGFLPRHDSGYSWWAVLCIAPIAVVVAIVERRRSQLLAWTAALEFFFIWFLLYAIAVLTLTKINHLISLIGKGHISHPHVLAVLLAIAAIFSAVMCSRVLVSSPGDRRCPVHPLLPAFLGCMAAGLLAGSFKYFHGHNVFGDIGAAFLFTALLLNLLAPFLALVRPRAPATVQRWHGR
jgi:CHAT domain